MTEDATVDPTPPEGSPPTREQLEALTVDELVEQHNTPRGKKADMVDAILEAHGVPTPKKGETVLAVGVPVHEHFWSTEKNARPITQHGTPVPSGKVADIIREAAAGGVTVYEVN